MAAPLLDHDAAPSSATDTPLPRPPQSEPPFTPLAGDLAPSPLTPPPQPSENATRLSPSKPGEDASLDSTLDVAGSASKKANQLSLIAQTRASAVPAPGLFIADEPLEPRPAQPSAVSAQRDVLTRMRIALMVLGGLLLMMAGALVVVFFRRSEEAGVQRATAASAATVAPPPGCRLALPPTRISPSIERSVPISAQPSSGNEIRLAIASTPSAALGWIYDAARGEPKRRLEAPSGAGEISHVTAGEPITVDRGTPDFAFAQTLAPGLALGVGAAGLLRQGADGATGVVWTLPTGQRVTAPRVAAVGDRFLVTFRSGGSQGKILTGWLRGDGSALGPLSPVHGVPTTLGTPNVAATDKEAVVVFAARGDKSEPYRIHAAKLAPGAQASPARPLELAAEGGGAIAPALAPLAEGRWLVQWTDGGVGAYRVHAQLLDPELKPLGEPLQVSAKGANAGQGTPVPAAFGAVSFFIQTTAGHDELWGASLSCR